MSAEKIMRLPTGSYRLHRFPTTGSASEGAGRSVAR